MRLVLLAAAALLPAAALFAAPADAQSFGPTGSKSGHSGPFGDFAAPPSGFGSPGSGVVIFRGDRDRHHGDRDRHRRDRRSGDTVVIGGGLGYYGGEWALYNNRTFESDSYNDWWHDRPDRAYPRWVTNGTCERLWWSGGGWRC